MHQPHNAGLHKIRVLHLITNFSLGGATENTLLSVEGLQNLGYDIRVLTGPNISSEGSLFERARQNDVRLEVIRELRRSIHPFYDVIAFFKIAKALRRGGYDIVHTHSSKAGFLGRVAAKMVGVPIIIHTIHGLPFHDFQSKVRRRVFILAERIGAAVSNKIIAVTDTIIQKAVAVGVGKKEKFAMVRSGFEMDQFTSHNHDAAAIRQEFGLRPDDLVVGKIARFSILKGHKYLINVIPKVVREVPNARFLFVGSGELEGSFKEQVQRQGVADHVIFTGLIEQERIPSLISIMDIVVHTSVVEGLARVLPQALAAGKPVISFDIDGASEVVIPGETGFLVEPCNEEQLGTTIIALLRDRMMAEKLGGNGSRLVRTAWTVSSMVTGIDRVYRELFMATLARGEEESHYGLHSEKAS